MEDGILLIQWETGRMNIRLDAFFPCPIQKFKKLLKVIDLDWEHSDTLKDILKVYFQEQIPVKKAAQKEWAIKYSDANQVVADLERMVQTRKKPVGVYLTKAELKQAKENLKGAKEERRNALHSYKAATSAIPKFEQLLQIINKNIGGT